MGGTKLLSGKSDSVLGFIEEHIDAWGYPPTITEISKEIGYSVGTVHSTLKDLMEDGKIRKEQSQHRSIFLVRDG